eukprot:scaffold22732_cov87-Phaeocystis_antarctica.AAC.1
MPRDCCCRSKRTRTKAPAPLASLKVPMGAGCASCGGRWSTPARIRRRQRTCSRTRSCCRHGCAN